MLTLSPTVVHIASIANTDGRIWKKKTAIDSVCGIYNVKDEIFSLDALVGAQVFLLVHISAPTFSIPCTYSATRNNFMLDFPMHRVLAFVEPIRTWLRCRTLNLGQMFSVPFAERWRRPCQPPAGMHRYVRSYETNSGS